MRKIGSSGVATGVSGIQEELAVCGATVAKGPGAKPAGESLPNLSDSIMSWPCCWPIYMKKKRFKKDFINEGNCKLNVNWAYTFYIQH